MNDLNAAGRPDDRPILRDGHGRFQRGTAPGPGNPDMRRVHELRTALLDEVAGDNGKRLRALVQAMLKAAIQGDVPAARLCLEYSLGKLAQSIMIGTDEGPAYKVLLNVDEDAL